MIQISVYSKMFLENSDCGCVKVKYVKKDHPTKERWSFSYAHKLTDNIKCGII